MGAEGHAPFKKEYLRMRVNQDTKRKIYVNPINYTRHTLNRLCSGVAVQPRLGLLSKRWDWDDIVDFAAVVVIGCDLATGAKR